MTSPGAQVSGPGALSKRTDTGGQSIRSLPDPKYGEATAFRQQQQAAPLANSAADAISPPPPMPRTGGPSPSPQAPAQPQPLPGLFDPGDPNIPVTTGAASGPGANTIAGLPGGGDFNPVSLRDALAPYVAADPTGILGNTIQQLSERGLW